MQPPLDWKAQLQGHSFDLDTLADLFGEGDPLIVKEGAVAYLSSSAFDPLTTLEQVEECAERLLDIANALGRLESDSYQPVTLTGSFNSKAGGGTIHVVITDTIGVRDQLLAPVSPRSLELKRVAFDGTNTRVAAAMRVLGSRAQLSWTELYKVLELIRKDVGGQKRLEGKTWVDKAKLSRFTHTANWLDAVSARHARGLRPAPEHPWTILEGRAFISALARGWLNEKR